MGTAFIEAPQAALTVLSTAHPLHKASAFEPASSDAMRNRRHSTSALPPPAARGAAAVRVNDSTQAVPSGSTMEAARHAALHRGMPTRVQSAGATMSTVRRRRVVLCALRV